MAIKKFVNIKLNDEGAMVKKIAAALRKHGSTIKLTSKFHIGMRSAVVKFQKNHGLPVTGEVDKKTLDKLLMPAPVFRKKPVAKK